MKLFNRMIQGAKNFIGSSQEEVISVTYVELQQPTEQPTEQPAEQPLHRPGWSIGYSSREAAIVAAKVIIDAKIKQAK